MRKSSMGNENGSQLVSPPNRSTNPTDPLPSLDDYVHRELAGRPIKTGVRPPAPTEPQVAGELLQSVLDVIGHDLLHVKRLGSDKLPHTAASDIANYAKALVMITASQSKAADRAKAEAERAMSQLSDAELLAIIASRT